ncbi:hypothetical protein Q7C_1358 [Methylophaga frappieri]|uniref:Iron uptake protein n=2 Tax=Methylophaga frappieri (strain ATCC BAA-2434 / DSM 25690 / JAM7) TaxID=754477 RepID=I1YHW5_METFJ|nr:hypothetical protein Q7C_1358 [Methylophaga frappieri]
MAGRTRGDVAIRSLLAVFAGYLLSGLWAALLSLLLPGELHQAVLTATITAFMFFTIYVIWVFHSQYLRHIVWGSALAGMVMLAGVLLLRSTSS